MNVRCHCGSLMARVTARGIELKCRRCKRLITVSAPVGGKWVMVDTAAGEAPPSG
jgi:phage FluMu protein Com